MCPLHGLFFSTWAHGTKPMLSPFVNIFFVLKDDSLYTSHNFINFTWFALFIHQIFDDRPLFKLGGL